MKENASGSEKFLCNNATHFTVLNLITKHDDDSVVLV